MTDAKPQARGELLLERLRSTLGSSAVEIDYPIGELTTYRVGGPAAFYVEVESVDDLRVICDAARESDLQLMIIGLGSNLLIPDVGFAGIALRLAESFADVDVVGERCIAGAAAPLPRVARQTVAAGLTGFEWAVGVPGSIGGAIRMNAGGHGSDMAASVVRVEGIDLQTGGPFSASADDLAFGYRTSSIASHMCVTEVELQLTAGDVAAGEAELSSIVRWRRENQPGGQNAGSVFVNPDGDSAGRLIDAAGCKGLRVGSAVVSDKHANFIQVDPAGSANDVLKLMKQVVNRVVEDSGTELVPETRILGLNYLPISTRERG